MAEQADPNTDPVLPVSLKRVPQISAYLDSIKNAHNDGVLKLRIDDIRKEKWTVAEWNAFGIAARVSLLNHASYGLIVSVIQEMGGY
ncbi:MAG: hypothetical protein QMC36_07265 [Patescibacteria group bacterium]